MSVITRSRLRILLFILWYGVAGTLSRMQYITFLTPDFVYLSAIVVWMITLRYRIFDEKCRRELMTMCLFMLLFFFCRYPKYYFFTRAEEANVLRMLWYLYYLSTSMISLSSFRTAMSMDFGDSLKTEKMLNIFYTVYILLLSGILTNDFHQLAFSFPQGLAEFEIYRHGPLWYVYIVFEYSFLLSTFIIMVRKSRQSVSVKEIVSMLVLPLLCLLFILIKMLLPSDFNFFINYPELYCLMYITFWEGAIQTGMMQSNSGYITFFNNSQLNAQLIDSEGNVQLLSQGAVSLHKDQLSLIQLDESTLLKHNAVKGGYIYWTDDISGINRMNTEIEEATAALEAERDLLAAENALKEEKIKLEEKKNIYSFINERTDIQMTKIRTMIETADRSPDLFDQCYCRASFMLVYVKRCSNMILKIYAGELIDENDLSYSLRESLDYLSRCSVSVYFHMSSGMSIESEKIFELYRLFESYAEQALPGLSGMIVNIDCEKDIRMRLTLENASYVPEEVSEHFDICKETEDENTYVVITGKEDDSYAV